MDVRLPRGWRLWIDGDHGYVRAPNGDTASITYATECGETSGDNPAEVPQDVLDELAKYDLV